jgi:Co/Zn/Cd efflux system component
VVTLPSTVVLPFSWMSGSDGGSQPAESRALSLQPACTQPLVVAASASDVDLYSTPTAAQRGQCCCGGVLTPNAKVLLALMGFFGAITAAQVFAALASNSAALMADCVSMGVDALSYGANALSEIWPQPDRRKQQRNQLCTAGVSYALLAYFTSMFLVGAVRTTMDPGAVDHSCCDAPLAGTTCVAPTSGCANATAAASTVKGGYAANKAQCIASRSGEGGPPEQCVWLGVDPQIVFVFALLGLLFDLFSLLAFRVRAPASTPPSTARGRLYTHHELCRACVRACVQRWGAPLSSLVAGHDSEALNMSSALMHVLSDCLRSSTTLVMSILIYLNPATPSYVRF